MNFEGTNFVDTFLFNLLKKKNLLMVVNSIFFIENYLLIFNYGNLSSLNDLDKFSKPSVVLEFLCYLAATALFILPLIETTVILLYLTIDQLFERKRYNSQDMRHYKVLGSDLLKAALLQQNSIAYEEYKKYESLLNENRLTKKLFGALSLMILCNSFIPCLTSSHTLSVVWRLCEVHEFLVIFVFLIVIVTAYVGVIMPIEDTGYSEYSQVNKGFIKVDEDKISNST